MSTQLIESRLRGALWGLFSGDALASPTHWYYGGYPQIQSDYGRQGITGYERPVTILQGSILNKSDPNGGGRRSYFTREGKGKASIIGDVINHGKLKYWDPKKSYHYHATLQAGENTLEAQLVRVLMKSIVANGGRFNADHFRNAYVEFMTTKGSHNDTYASTCHRMFFANLFFRKKALPDCPDNDGHNVDAIDGLVLPTVTALAEAARIIAKSDESPYGVDDASKELVRAAAANTVKVTRRSPLLEKVSEVWSDLIISALTAPTIGESSKNSMHQILAQTARKLGMSRSPRPDGRDEMSACYISHSLPTALDMLSKYTQQSLLNENPGETCWKALIANANVGGENVHRGAVIGAILGARAGDDNLPTEMKAGLHDSASIAKEIDAFVDVVIHSTKLNCADKAEEVL